MTYKEEKARKLKRMPLLKVFSLIGMVAWRDEYGSAQQKMRLLHPFNWLWFVFCISLSVVMSGVPETLKELKYAWKYDTVWW